MSSQTLLEKCCLIGQPVAGNPTHYMIEQAIRQAGSDWRFLTFEVSKEDFADAMRGVRALGLRGVKLIAPHREAVLEFVDEQSDHAQLARSANCVTRRDGRLIADNTTGQALAKLVGEIAAASGFQVTIFGAGRAAAAIGAALALCGAAGVTFISRTAEPAMQLVSRINSDTNCTATHEVWPDSKYVVASDVNLLINATSLGTTDPDEPLPIDVDSLRPDLIVADISFNPPNTWLLEEATRRQCQVIDGLSILVEQTALALQDWSGIEADRHAMREAAEEFLVV